MSQFRTVIPINVRTILEKLPKRSHVVSFQINDLKDQVEVVWSCDDLKTPYTFPVDYPLEMLQAGGERPKEVLPAKSEPFSAATVSDKGSVDTGGKRRRK